MVMPSILTTLRIFTFAFLYLCYIISNVLFFGFQNKKGLSELAANFAFSFLCSLHYLLPKHYFYLTLS